MDLSVIIVHYKTPQRLTVCLDTLPAGIGRLSHEILVVDNHSQDGTAERLTERASPVTVIANDANVGYARAVNQGIRASRGEFLLVMNPDCELHAGAAERLVEHLRAHPRTAIAAPRILNADGTLEYSARAFPDSFTFLFNRYSLLTRVFPHNRFSRRYLLTDWDHATVRDVDWVSGACLAVRRSAVHDVGPMDEAFFMFNEDVDWCRRMNQGGWAVTYVPDAVATHHIGASRSRVEPRVILARHQGMIHYFHKHHPRHPLIAACADAFIMMRAGVMVAANVMRLR